MSTVAPPRRPETIPSSDPEALIEEARARQRQRRLRLIIAAVVLAAIGGGIYGGFGGAADQSPTIPVIERNLGDALAKSRTTLILRVHKHRTRTPQYVTAVEWVDLANGDHRLLWYDVSGRITTDTSRSYSGKLPPPPNQACRCDLDPFTDFPSAVLRVSLLGQQTIDRQSTFHLMFTATYTGEPRGPITTDIWIDRSTYLPVREKVAFRETPGNSQSTITTNNDFTWLPRTRANLAQLAAG